ncbi:YheC/YheD family protein [Paenibacillus thermotolerans]|uniref:YheC/YheD family protein n=1 Tax=Paenibacillus thermotolerans TaxID=3027807 RepID=UPI002367E7AC|nr:MULTISPECIES: YheC/YheD family protein [unclassified Paenibacillus]
MSVRIVYGKLRKGNAMRSDRTLRKHLPETYPYKPATVLKMIRKYSSVFIKPDKGSQGKGIIRIRRLSSDKVQISWGLRHRKVPSGKAVRTLSRLLRPNSTYLIQQGLELEKYKNRKFDIRIFMQKPQSKWFISGRIVRVGAPGRFVTNYSQGASPQTIENVFNSIYKNRPNNTKQMIKKIDALCFALAKRMDRKFPGVRELGIDIGVDKKSSIWIIEANTTPQFNSFKRLSDKTMYKRILARHRYIYRK